VGDIGAVSRQFSRQLQQQIGLPTSAAQSLRPADSLPAGNAIVESWCSWS
jgi:hypothetical protein